MLFRSLDKWEQGILTVDIYQEIKELPTGKYKLVAAGRSNDDAYSFYANNSSETKYVSIINNSNTGGDLGNGWNDVEIDNIIVKTGYLKIGASVTATKNGAWISIDNFRLYYYGADLSLIHDELNDLIAKANNFDFESVPAGVAENLKETILKAQSVEEKEESIRAMIDELTLVLSEANSYIEYFTSLKTSIEEIESLQNSWFNDLIEDAKAVAESESPTLDELISAKDDLFDGIIKMMDKYSGISFTQIISNPSINNGTNGWTINNKNGNHTYTKGEHYTYDNMNTYLDSWNGTKGALDYEAKQTVSALPNGLYVVSAAA